MTAERILEVRDLSVAYGKVEALSNANLDVHGGQIVTVIGPNGAGKTTLLAAIMGALPANGTAPAPYPYYGWGLWHPWPFFGFGCFGPLIALLFLFLAFRALSFLFWGPRWGRWGHMRRGWRHGWDDEDDVPPMFREWHDRAHGQTTQPQESDKS